MNNDINKLIREELIKKRKNNLVESLSPLNDIDDKDFFFHSYIQKSSELLDEGYSIEEIEQIAENMFTDKILQGGGGVAKDIWGSTNILDALFGGGLGMIKEQVIRWVLVNLGVGKGAANFLAAFLEQTDPRELLRLFKSPESCTSGMPKISDGLMAGIVRYLQYGEKDVKLFDQNSDVLGLALGNVLDEVITQSNIGEKVGEKLCAAIWKK
jgi:hypothetical protein